MSAVRVWLAKHGVDLKPADEGALKVVSRMEDGEVALFKPVRVRDPVAHRRYWALMTMCAENCERIEIRPSIWITVRDKDDVHTAVKLCTGHYDSILGPTGKTVAVIPKSTSFDEMTADEWNEYWPKVLDVVEEKIMANIRSPEAELELMKCMGWAR